MRLAEACMGSRVGEQLLRRDQPAFDRVAAPPAAVAGKPGGVAQFRAYCAKREITEIPVR